MTKNLLVDWMNNNKTNRANMLASVQSNMANKTTATNPTTVSTPNTPIISRPTTNLNLQKAQQPVQTRLDNLNNQTLPTNSGAGTVTGIQTPTTQSRFIGFQQQPQGMSFNKLMNNEYTYIPTEATKAETLNKQEEDRYRTASEALMDFQGDVLKNNGKMTDWQLKTRYPEFSDKIDVLKELQTELRPIVQSGMGVDVEQIAEYYPELLQAKNTVDVDKVKEKSDLNNKQFQNLGETVDKILKTSWKDLSVNGVKYVRDVDILKQHVEDAKKKGVLGGANDWEILTHLADNNSDLQAIMSEMKDLELTKNDKAILGRKDTTSLLRVKAMATEFIDSFKDEKEKAGLDEIESVIRGKEALESDFGNQTWKKIATEINVPLDSLEKFTYRTYKDIQNEILKKGADYTKDYVTKKIKSALKDGLGVDLTDEQAETIKNLYDKGVMPSIQEDIKTNQQNVMDYTESVNKEYEAKKAANLNPDIENYVNSKSMTRSLLQGDLKSFLYKSSGEAAQNAEMPLMVLAGTVAPEIVLPLMTMDSYARESQESFEELMDVQQKMGIPQEQAYSNAQEGAAIVGIASAAVEVGLEKLIGGVETTASKAFHDLIIKDVAEKTTKMVAERGLVDLLKQGLTTQFRSSFEEGLEEIVQQWIHNKAIQKYDPDHKLTEGLAESFEGGFFNWMNLLGGGGDVLSNIQQNSESLTQQANQAAYNLGEKTRAVVDSIKSKTDGGDDGGGTPPAAPTTRQNVLSELKNKITTQNQDTNVVELQDDTGADNQTTTLKEGGMGEKVMEFLNGLDENTRERIKKNPYSVEESKNLIDEMDNNPGIDFGDWQNARYEEVLNTILDKLEQKEDKRRNDIGSLYDKLEATNAPVDVTELKNKVAEFQAQKEALGDIITTAEQAQIDTILKNIQEIGDGTMDVWKVRRIADKRTKGSASSSYDGIGLIRDIRDTIDSIIREQNPEMKEVDKAYRKVLNEISEIKGKLLYKKGGQVKSNAVSTVKNMLNAGSRIDLNNLEKYLPGIKDKLEAIRDSKFVYNAYTTGKGSRFISGIARGVFGNIGKALGFVGFGWGGLLGGAILDAGIDKALVNLTRKALRETITKETEKSKAELERINKKIEEGKALDAKDKARLKELGEKIEKRAEEANKTKAEQEAWDKYFEGVKNQQALPESIKLTKVTEINKANKPKNKVTKKKSESKNNQKKVVTSDNNPEGLSLEGQPITDNITINDKNTSQTKTDAKKITKDSEGNTLSKEDQEKFGNSKIVDKDGNLLVVMHGSSNQETHDYYDETKAGSNVHADFKGVYFTDNLDLAEQFAHEQLPGSSAFRTVLGKRGHLYKSYVNITNPLNLNTATPEQLLPFFREDVLTKTWDEEKRLDNLKGHPQFVKFHVDMDKVEKAGYDGIIAAIGKEGEGNEYIAFKGNQAKNIGEVEAPQTETEDQPKNKVTKKTPKKKAETTEYINETPQNERGQMEEIEAEENLRNNETPQRDMVEETPKNKVTAKKTEATAPKQEENQTLTKVDGKAQPTQEQRKLIRDWLEKQDLNRDHPFMPILLNDISTKGVRDYVYGAISQILGHSGIDFNKATDFFKSIGIDPEGWEREMKSAPEYYYKGKIVNEKKNVVTDKAKVTEGNTTPKTETKQEVGVKPVEKSDLREKIGDRFYDYLQKQVEIINENRKEFGKEPITVEDLNLNDELYINKFEKIAQEELSEIQNELSEINKDLPQAPALTDEQREQLNKAENQTGRNKLLRKWQDEWLENNPISEEKAEQIREIMERAADIIEQHNKARNYIYDSQIAEENKEYEDKYSEESKTKATTNSKNKVTNPSKAKTTSLFNENEVDNGKGSEGLNPDALPLSDYREMQRLNDEEYYPLSNALGKRSLKLYMAKKIATELVGNYDEIIADEFDPDNLEDKYVEAYNNVIDMYEGYEEYSDLKNDGDTDENTLKNTLSVANSYADKLYKGKTAKELIDQYKPEYKSDLEVYNRLDKKYPGVFDNLRVDLTGLENKSRREFANQENETAQDIDYQELAEGENETAQIPTIFEEDLQESNIRNLEENETAQTTEEEMNKVTKKEANKPKNLVTSKIEESDNTDSKAEQIFNTSMEQLKKAKKVSLGALGKVKQTEVKLDNGTTITYIDSSVGKGISQNAIIRINSPEAGYKTYVVTKIPNNPAEIREGGNVLTDEQVDKVYDILQGKNGEVKVEDMKVDVENVEDKKDPINAFLDNNEAIKNDPKLKYKYLSRLNDQTSWIDYSTDIRYNGTVAEKVQQTIDSFGKLSNGTRLPIKFSKNNYGNYIEVGDWQTGLASRNIGDDIEFEYAKFLYDNPEIRSTKEMKADGLKEAIKKGNEIHKEVVKDAEEQKDGTPLDPEKYIRQQPTADEGIEAVYNETKKISDYFEARKEQENSGRIGYTEEYRNKIKAAQDALWRKLKFKSDRSKLYQDFVKNIKESNGNEKQLRSIAKNLYIQKVKDDFKNNYNYPTEVTDKVPGLRTAKDNYERYLKGRDTSFSGKDPRIDYSDKDRIGAGIKRQDGNQVTAAQRREIVNGVLEYAKYMGIDMKKMSEDAGVTYVHLNGKHPFLTKSAVGLFHGLFKSISVGADMESYSEKGKGRDAKLETHTVPVVMAHEITHAIDSMFERSLFSDQKTREMGRKMNDGRGLGDYRWRKAEITARMVEEYVDVMKGGEGYYNMRGYWDKDVFDNEIKPYVEQIFDEKFNGYKLTAKERNDIKLDEAPKSNNSITATDLNKVTNR